ncbi:hypothetical protein B0H10DRAFT_1815742 [Mycena sp. CBHHK59/15]|nr:hypothetical protein B0H10DRAFT_1815742 [Mycena sp. CBHHK59/15]
MGVELPPKTKLPDNELEKRLSKTLDGCQYLTRVVPSLLLNPSAYKPWHMDPTNKPVFTAVRRHNIAEANFIYDNRMRGNDDPFPLYASPFMDLRQSIMTIGKNWDEGASTMMLQDKEQKACICIRVLEVLKFDEETPILMVLFHQEVRGTLPTDTFKWVMLHGKDSEHGKRIVQIVATLKEQHLLMRLLQRNSERLPASYNPQRTNLERSFVPSFLIPVGPLGGKEIARFNINNGCSVCGDPAKSKCSR